jgi:uncharacterized cupin superfamily protein
VLLSVELDDEDPTRRLRLHYQSHAGGEYDAYWRIWDDQGVSGRPMAAGRPNLESPASLVGLVASNWADGSIRADDAPYWHAVERQRRAIADWRAAFPEAVAAPAGFRSRTASLGPLLQAERLGATVVELDEGQGSEPNHYECGREEWLLVLTGTPTLRHPGGTEVLAAGEMVCFPEGPTGAHQLINHSEHVARLVLISTLGLPANVHYPDSGKWLLRNGPDDQTVMLRDEGPVGYWDGEA